MLSLPLMQHLQDSEVVLLCGCGGGFDLYCGIPLYFALRDQGKEVILGNLTFSPLTEVEAERPAPSTVLVSASSESPVDYFPEKYLCEYLEEEGIDQSIYCFQKTGVQVLRRAYETIVGEHNVDTILLVDGGTDSLMRGDEIGLGTPAEDLLSIAAAHQVEVERKLLVCLGFGIDAFHGVCHAHFLEAVAALSRSEAFLGAFSLTQSRPEVAHYLEAVAYAHRRMPMHPSIVNASIASALEGEYGDVHRTNRTRGSTLWINPLMTIYWAFLLDAVAERLLYFDAICDSTTFNEVVQGIEAHVRGLKKLRPRFSIPV